MDCCMYVFKKKNLSLLAQDQAVRSLFKLYRIKYRLLVHCRHWYYVTFLNNLAKHLTSKVIKDWVLFGNNHRQQWDIEGRSAGAGRYSRGHLVSCCNHKNNDKECNTLPSFLLNQVNYSCTTEKHTTVTISLQKKWPEATNVVLLSPQFTNLISSNQIMPHCNNPVI